MAKIKLDKEIESIEVPWSTSSEMYKGSRVEEFIKKQFKSKAGYLSRTTDKETDGNYHLRGFADVIMNGTATRKHSQRTSCLILPCQVATGRVRQPAIS